MFQMSLSVSGTILHTSVIHPWSSPRWVNVMLLTFSVLWKHAFTASKAVTSYFFSTLTTFKHLPGLSSSVSSVQFSSFTQLCPTLCDPMNHSTPGLPVHHQLQEFTQIHIQRVSDAIQPSHPRSSPSPPAPNPSQNQSLFQWVSSSHEVAKVLEFQL